eukprot:Lankesteria_metandrocarpae@DN9086_c0_g1_i1.p1
MSARGIIAVEDTGKTPSPLIPSWPKFASADFSQLGREEPSTDGQTTTTGVSEKVGTDPAMSAEANAGDVGVDDSGADLPTVSRVTCWMSQRFTEMLRCTQRSVAWWSPSPLPATSKKSPWSQDPSTGDKISARPSSHNYDERATTPIRVRIDEPKGNVGRLSRRFFMTTVGSFMQWWCGKIIIVTVFVGLLVAAAFGIKGLESGLELEDLTPVDSYLRDFYATSREKFDVSVYPSYVYFISAAEEDPQVPWWSEAAREGMYELENALLEIDDTQDVLNSLESFHKHAESRGVTLNETNYDSELHDWLETSLLGQNAARDYAVTVNDDGTVYLEGWRMQVF